MAPAVAVCKQKAGKTGDLASADAGSPAVAMADQAMEITGASPVAAYLDGDQIVAAATSMGAEAIRQLLSLVDLAELQKDAKEGAADEQAVLRRERKRRIEAAAAFRDNGR